MIGQGPRGTGNNEEGDAQYWTANEECRRLRYGCRKCDRNNDAFETSLDGERHRRTSRFPAIAPGCFHNSAPVPADMQHPVPKRLERASTSRVAPSRGSSFIPVLQPERAEPDATVDGSLSAQYLTWLKLAGSFWWLTDPVFSSAPAVAASPGRKCFMRRRRHWRISRRSGGNSSHDHYDHLTAPVS